MATVLESERMADVNIFNRSAVEYVVSLISFVIVVVVGSTE